MPLHAFSNLHIIFGDGPLRAFTDSPGLSNAGADHNGHSPFRHIDPRRFTANSKKFPTNKSPEDMSVRSKRPNLIQLGQLSHEGVSGCKRAWGATHGLPHQPGSRPCYSVLSNLCWDLSTVKWFVTGISHRSITLSLKKGSVQSILGYFEFHAFAFLPPVRTRF